MLRLHVAVLLSLFSLPTLASETTTSIASRRTDKGMQAVKDRGLRSGLCTPLVRNAAEILEAML